MSNYGNNYKYASSADVVALAAFLAQRQSDSGTTNGGIIANGNPAVPLLGQGGANDPNGIATAYLQGMADALLCAMGFQAQFDVGSGNASTSSTSFVNLVSCSWTPPLSRNYLIHVDTAAYNNTAGGNVLFRLVVGGVTLTPLSSMAIINNEASSHKRLSFRQPAAFTAGAPRTIQLQWSVSSGIATQDVNDFNVFTISGG